MKRILTMLAAFALLATAFAQTRTVDMTDRTIAEVLDTVPQLSLLNVMTDAAGLDEVLAGEGPFTLFAPVDRAWLGVGDATLRDLLRDAESLSAVLQYHVVPEEIRSERLLDELTADAERRVGEGTAEALPEPEQAADPQTDEAADGDQPAPLDEQQIGDEATANLEIEEPVQALLATGVTSAVQFPTAQGTDLEVVAGPAAARDEGGGQRIGEGDELMGIWEPVEALRSGGVDLMIQDARILSVDILASNGVIHLIDGLLVPEGVGLTR